MISWSQSDIEDYLGGPARVETCDSPQGGQYQAYVFALRVLGWDCVLVVHPLECFSQIRDAVPSEHREPVSAYIHCTKISVNREDFEEGGDCIVFSGRGGTRV
jgi:hypothetical protein